ncbi:MAG: restriction endonuclease [Ponticaulis sp.]|nr:restriction endonuclease [Ponticaulis sp.]
MGMKKGYLSEYFDAVAIKTLSAVDAEPKRSNQHEIGGKTSIGKVLGRWEPQVTFDVSYFWFGEDDQLITATGKATWYDTRRDNPNRAAEPRLYYEANAVTGAMKAGDTLIVARRSDNSLLIVVCEPGTTIQKQLLWLFGFDEGPGALFQVSQISGAKDQTLGFAAKFILEELGVEIIDPEANRIETIIEPFGLKLPKTKEFSDLARRTLPEISPLDDPDAALLAWIDHEERMFRQLEKRIVADRLVKGFFDDRGEPDVDGFIKFSLSVQNTRKSRMGLSFEHHVGALFEAHQLKFATQARTERGNKPDFLFPGQLEYDNQSFSSQLLTLLAAKSTCKERWRQISSEADRIERKHLITIEPGISEAQTRQMHEQSVQLVVPGPLHETFSASQRDWLWSAQNFIDLVKERQARAIA